MWKLQLIVSCVLKWLTKTTLGQYRSSFNSSMDWPMMLLLLCSICCRTTTTKKCKNGRLKRKSSHNSRTLSPTRTTTLFQRSSRHKPPFQSRLRTQARMTTTAILTRGRKRLTATGSECINNNNAVDFDSQKVQGPLDHPAATQSQTANLVVSQSVNWKQRHWNCNVATNSKKDETVYFVTSQNINPERFFTSCIARVKTWTSTKSKC